MKTRLHMAPVYEVYNPWSIVNRDLRALESALTKSKVEFFVRPIPFYLFLPNSLKSYRALPTSTGDRNGIQMVQIVGLSLCLPTT